MSDTILWRCEACDTRRDVPYRNTGDGIPACPNCQQPMSRTTEEAWLARGLEKLRTFPGGMGEP